MNSIFSFNVYKKNIFFPFLAAGFCPKNLAFARKITVLPESGRLQPPHPLARMPMMLYKVATSTTSSVEQVPNNIFECILIHGSDSDVDDCVVLYGFWYHDVTMGSWCLTFFAYCYTYMLSCKLCANLIKHWNRTNGKIVSLKLVPISWKCWVPNNCRVSNKRRGSEACVLINTGSQLNAGSQINAWVFW